MSGRWKPPKSERIDAEMVRRKKLLGEKLAFEVEFGTEGEFVAAVKEFKPDVRKRRVKRLDYAVSRRPPVIPPAYRELKSACPAFPDSHPTSRRES